MRVRERGQRRWRAVAVCVLGVAAIGGWAGCQSAQPEGDVGSEQSGAIGAPAAEGVWSDYQAAPPMVSPVVPVPVQARYAQVRVDGQYVALTFDDGPSRHLTPQLLDILKERDVRATFFVVGRRVAAHPEILERIAGEGHEIGNHTWDHPSLEKLSPESVREQLERTNQVIRAVVGSYPVVMRPPYGRTNDLLNRRIWDDFGLKVILWSVDSSDWRHRDMDLVRWEILEGAQAGAIVLSHDTQPSTIAAMPGVLDDLLARGFQFVTVSELIALGGKLRTP